MNMLQSRALSTSAAVVTICISFAFTVACEAETPVSERSVEAKAIQWSLLAPRNGKPFNDPFAKLTDKQLANLSYVVRVRQLIADEKIDSDGRDAEDATQVARELEQQGIDVGWLLVQRQRVRQIRGLQVEQLSRTIARSLGDREIAMIGYVMPITIDQGQMTEFFLVPTVAACSHESGPPPLQVVYVSLPQGFAVPDKATPVRVTGVIKARSKAKTKVSASGKATVRSAYTIMSPRVESYTPAPR